MAALRGDGGAAITDSAQTIATRIITTIAIRVRGTYFITLAGQQAVCP
jgi:hypothetical protein